jgi:hypothetical protein
MTGRGLDRMCRCMTCWKKWTGNCLLARPKRMIRRLPLIVGNAAILRAASIA